MIKSIILFIILIILCNIASFHCSLNYGRILKSVFESRDLNLPDFYSITTDTYNVWDRKNQVLIQETVPAEVNFLLNIMYISSSLSETDFFKSQLRSYTESCGSRYSDPTQFKTDYNTFISNYGQIDLSDFAINISLPNITMNDFITRPFIPGARPINASADIISPTDCRMSVFPYVSDAAHIWIKGTTFSISTLLQNETLEEEFRGGSIVIARLAPQDYHRFHHPIDGNMTEPATYFNTTDYTYFELNPKLVNTDIDVFTQNVRAYHVIESEKLGKMVYIAIGATCIGSINYINDTSMPFSRGDLHGEFKFGGSTVILLFQYGKVKYDNDLLLNSANALETYILMGDRVGIASP